MMPVVSFTKVSFVWKADYEPFGKANITIETITNNLRLPGQYYDAEIGRHYNINRNYNPDIGRYGESDPIGLDGGINTYSYVRNNPIMRIDPLGLFDNAGNPEGWEYLVYDPNFNSADDSDNGIPRLIDPCCEEKCKKQYKKDEEEDAAFFLDEADGCSGATRSKGKGNAGPRPGKAKINCMFGLIGLYTAMQHINRRDFEQCLADCTSK